MIRLVFGSEKFWDARVDGKTLRTQFGKPGKPGQIRLKDYASPAAAKAGMAAAVGEKRAEGYTEAGAKPAKPAKPNKRRDALLALAGKLGADAKGLADIALAFDDPDAYYEKYEERCDDRSLEPDDDEFAWLALVDALERKKKLAGLDWKHEGDDALKWISGLAGPAGKTALAPILKDKDGTLDDRPTDEVLELAGATLAPLGLAVLHLEINGDEFEIVVVPSGDVAGLVALARASGNTITQFAGKKLAALEKTRAKAEAKQAAKERSTNKWTQSLVMHGVKTLHDYLWELTTNAHHLECLRDDVAAAPPRDRPFVELVISMNTKAAATAQGCEDPRAGLRALAYFRTGYARDRLAAVATLARRLKLAPGTGKDHELVAFACNLFDDEKAITAAHAKLPAADRDLLARLADGYLEGARHGQERWATAYRALRSVADVDSLVAIERNRPRSGEWKDDIDSIIDEEYLAVIRRRLKLPKLPARVVPPRRDGKRLAR